MLKHLPWRNTERSGATISEGHRGEAVWYIPLGLSSSMVTMVAGGPGRDSLHSAYAQRKRKLAKKQLSSSLFWNSFLCNTKSTLCLMAAYENDKIKDYIFYIGAKLLMYGSFVK